MSIRMDPDTKQVVIEGEGADLWRRVTGRLADLALWAVLLLLLAAFTGSDAGDEMIYPVWFYPAVALAPITYEAVTVRWRHGQTLGKTWAGTRAITLSGDTPGLMRATVRAALTWPFVVIATDDQLGAMLQIPAIVVFAAIFAVAVVNPRRRGLHDLAAGTIVIAASTRQA